MSGMPFFDALLLLASVVGSHRGHAVAPFPSVSRDVLVASAFGLAAGLSISLVGRAFGIGFSQALYSPGLVIVAAGLVSGLAESTGAADRIEVTIGRWRWFGAHHDCGAFGPDRRYRRFARRRLCAADAAASADQWWRYADARSGCRSRWRWRFRQAMVSLFSPVLIAAASILDAAWGRVALFGLPLALLLAVIGAAWARWQPVAGAALPSMIEEPLPTAQKQAGWAAIVLILATAIPLLMLMEQSIGAMPSEPLGGGTARELVLGVGRPLILFVVGVGIMVIGLWRPSMQHLARARLDQPRLGQCRRHPADRGRCRRPAAALPGNRAWRSCSASVCSTGMSADSGGLLIPFLIAAVIKTLQGSSLVAAIAAAGMVQPILMPLGLDGDNGKALATLAVGAGAMTAAHINDEFFWLVSTSAGFGRCAGSPHLQSGRCCRASSPLRCCSYCQRSFRADGGSSTRLRRSRSRSPRQSGESAATARDSLTIVA